MMNIEVCPGTLAPGFNSYSPVCCRKLFDGKKVSPILDFDYNTDNLNLAEVINQISLSGVQEKLSGIVDKGKIILTPVGQQGHYIIKPIPNYLHLQFRQQIPANEHLTMQIARQVYKINTAENGLVFFANGEPAYITKRFDFDENGNKIKQEDFSSLARKTARTHGQNYKYTGSYEDVATILKYNIPAWQIELTKLFTLIVFNYMFANGDAHMKNFSLQQSPDGDYLLSPAYDLMNTSLHVKDTDFALKGGLIPESDYSETYRKTGHPCHEDFATFGKRIGVHPTKINSVLAMFSEKNSMVTELTERSFLDKKTKRMYLRSYNERISRFLR